jgi:hypothetical protein
VSDYQPQVGDRVSMSGTVTHVSPTGTSVSVDADNGQHTLMFARALTLVERPSPAEEWQPGDVVRSADDPQDTRVWTFYKDGVEDKLAWHNIRSGWNHRSGLPANLRLLVRDGQPVSQPEPSHPQPGDVVSEEPPVGSVVRDRSDSKWTHFKPSQWWCGDVPDGLQSGNEFAWVQTFGPLTLVRWGAGQ